MKQELIEIVKLRGRLMKFEIIELENEKFCQLVMMLYKNQRYVIQTVLNNHIDKCHYEDGYEFEWESEATHRFEIIINTAKKNQDK